MTRIALLAMAMLIVSIGSGCDPLRKDKCEWYLVPEPEHKDLVKDGWVSICARNFVNNRQKCYLQATMADAKAIYGQKVIYSQLKIDKSEFPHTITNPTTCGK